MPSISRIPSKAFYRPPINDWQLVQIHEVAEPPSCVSMDEFPTQKQFFISLPRCYERVREHCLIVRRAITDHTISHERSKLKSRHHLQSFLALSGHYLRTPSILTMAMLDYVILSITRLHGMRNYTLNASSFKNNLLLNRYASWTLPQHNLWSTTSKQFCTY